MGQRANRVRVSLSPDCRFVSDVAPMSSTNLVASEPNSEPKASSLTTSSLKAGWVPKTQYDALHARYTDLVASTTASAGKKAGDGRKRRQKGAAVAGAAAPTLGTVGPPSAASPAPGLPSAPAPGAGPEGEERAIWAARIPAGGDGEDGAAGPTKRKKRSVRLEVRRPPVFRSIIDRRSPPTRLCLLRAPNKKRWDG